MKNTIKVLSLFAFALMIALTSCNKEDSSSDKNSYDEGSSLEYAIFNQEDEDGTIGLSLFLDELINVIVAIGPLLEDDEFLDEFEDVLPVVLGLDESVLEEDGDIVEGLDFTLSSLYEEIAVVTPSKEEKSDVFFADKVTTVLDTMVHITLDTLYKVRYNTGFFEPDLYPDYKVINHNGDNDLVINLNDKISVLVLSSYEFFSR